MAIHCIARNKKNELVNLVASMAATSLGIGTVWLGILILIKNEVLNFLGEPQGEFMAVVPVGYPLRHSNSPKKHSLETCVKYLS